MLGVQGELPPLAVFGLLQHETKLSVVNFSVRKAVGRPWSPRTPVWAVKFGARYVVRVDPSLVLTGRRCIPKKLLAEGFRLQHTNLAQTLWELLTEALKGQGQR